MNCLRKAFGTLLVFALGGSSACGSSAAGSDGTAIQLETPRFRGEDRRVEARITCEAPSAFSANGEMVLVGSDGPWDKWEGRFEVPEGDCLLTFLSWCEGEIACSGSQTFSFADGGSEPVELVMPCSGSAAEGCALDF